MIGYQFAGGEDVAIESPVDVDGLSERRSKIGLNQAKFAFPVG